MSANEHLLQIRSTAPITVGVCGCSVGIAIPIAQIAIGAIYLNDCPRQPFIPIYLIVMGTFSLVVALCSGGEKSRDSPSNPICMVCNLLVSMFLFGWFIAGNVWIYSIYEPNYNKTITDVVPYCDKTLYLFAFWTTTASYILIGFALFLGCCFALCVRCCATE
uniref:Si:dkey-19b23.12 n=1 Tax=Stegastes partitus TaxID=144197 RepID=A0A3B5AEM5_9TELE